MSSACDRQVGRPKKENYGTPQHPSKIRFAAIESNDAYNQSKHSYHSKLFDKWQDERFCQKQTKCNRCSYHFRVPTAFSNGIEISRPEKGHIVGNAKIAGYILDSFILIAHWKTKCLVKYTLCI